MREGYTSQAKKALAYAVKTAEKCGHNYVGTEHLLIGLLNVEDGTAGMVLTEFHVDAGQLTELIDRLIAPGGNTATESRPGYTPRVRRVLENAEAEAARFKSRAVGTEHLLIAILKESDCVATRLLFTMGINIQKLYSAILTAMGEAPSQGGMNGNPNAGRGPQARGGAQNSETPALDQYSRDLTVMASEGRLDPVFYVLDHSDVPAKNLLPTHILRNPGLIDAGADLVRRGGYIDCTAGADDVEVESDAMKLYELLHREGVKLDHVTISSDAFGSQPRFNEEGECIGLTYASPKYLHRTIQILVREGMPLEDALQLLTSTPAVLLGKEGIKGCVAEGADADLLVLDENLNINSLFARGKVAVWEQEVKMKGRFEQ